MPLESVPNCQDFQKRFDLFFDGEIDGRTMRSLALHVTRCRTCEGELRQAERLQDLFAQSVRTQVDGIDVAELWRSVEDGLDTQQASTAVRIRERWQFRSAAETKFVAIAASAAFLLVLAATLWDASPVPELARVADNKAHIDALSSSSQAVAVWTEPRQQTTAIFVASYEP